MLAIDAKVRSGVNSWSFTISNVKVRAGARSDCSVSFTGTSAGPAPSVPAMAVERSWRIVPTTSPMAASFCETFRLGSSVCTRARVIGKSVGPRLKNGWPNA